MSYSFHRMTDSFPSFNIQCCKNRQGRLLCRPCRYAYGLRGLWPAPYFPLFERSLSFRKSAHVSDRRIVAGAAAVCHDRLPGHVTASSEARKAITPGDVFRLPGVIHRIVRDEQFLVLVGQRPFGRWGQHHVPARRSCIARRLCRTAWLRTA